MVTLQLQEERQRGDTMGRMLTAIERLGGERAAPPPRLVDTRGIGRPPNFGSGEEKTLEKNFPVWQRKMQNYIVSVFPDFQDPLRWAANTSEQITEIVMEDTFGRNADETMRVGSLMDKDHQLYAVLVQVTESEANDIVCNSDGHGLEAWRKLSRRWNPLTGGRIRNMLRAVISPGKASWSELERWENECSKYGNSKDSKGIARTIPEEIKMAALESLVPAELETHLRLNASKFTDYISMRAEVVSYIESRTGSRMKVPDFQSSSKSDPMDVDSLAKEGKGGFSGACFSCGQTGHRAAECPQRGKGGKDKGKGKSWKGGKSDGKGKGFGKKGTKGKEAKGDGKGKDKNKGKGKTSWNEGWHTYSLEDSAWMSDWWSPEEWWGQGEAEEWWGQGKGGAEKEQEAVAWGSAEPSASPPVSGLELCAIEDISSFRTASGEIIEDGGAIMIKGFLESGAPCVMHARKADVHKPLVSASKMLRKGMMVILNEHGGEIIPKASKSGWRADELLKAARAKEEQSIRLHAENGVYNFYIRNEQHAWHRFNFDTGAAETVMPLSLLRGSGGPGQAHKLSERRGETLAGGSAGLSSEARGSQEPLRAGSPAEVDEDLMHGDDEEFQEPRRVREAESASRAEREEHELLGHVQYRTWCRHCVASRAIGQPHRSVPEDPHDATVPELVMDYYFLGEENATVPHVVLKDRKSDAYFSTCLDVKGSTYAIAFIAGAVQWLGYKRVVMKSDGEPSIVSLKKKAIESLPGVECVPKEAPVGDSRAQGAAENAVKQLKGMIRTLKTATEERYMCSIGANNCLLAWMPRHCADLLTRFRRYADGRTAVQRLTGRKWGRPSVVFGENIMIKVASAKPGRRAGLEPRMVSGVYVGHHGRSGALMALTEEGMMKARSFRKRPDEERFDSTMLGKIKGVPWDLTGEFDVTKHGKPLVSGAMAESLPAIVSPT
eukprot:6483103-Amphidinium_carterae.1